MLFDDILWAERAREEHDNFVAALRRHGVDVFHFADLLAETLDIPAARDHVLDRICSPQMVGPGLVEPLRRLAEDVEALADRVFAERGPVDLLANNAGVFVGGSLWERPVADLEWVLGVNLWGILHGIRAFVPRMIELQKEYAQRLLTHVNPTRATPIRTNRAWP